MTRDTACAHSRRIDTGAALRELRPQLAGIDPVVMLFFCSSNHDGLMLSSELKKLAPSSVVLGCTTSGEFTNAGMSQGGVVVLALSKAKVKRCSVQLTEYDKGQSVEQAVVEASSRMSRELGIDMREIDPERWVGVVLNEGMNGNEEDVAATLGHVAPFISFVGGSAGDNLTIKECTVFVENKKSTNGSALLLMELAVPYSIVKTCSFEATEKKVRITKVKHRMVYEMDGQPVLQRYAELVGVKPEQLDNAVFANNPLGLMIEGEPWVRSPNMILPDGSLMFGCRLLEGSELYLLKPTMQLVNDTKAALAKGAAELGVTPSVGLLFNCAHRCVEIELRCIDAQFTEGISAFPTIGFNSYGESYLAQLNQTLIGLLIG
jgi:hypothetical protein